MSDSGSGVVHPKSTTSHVFWVTEEDIGEGGVSLVYTSDGEGVLFTQKFVNTLLALTGEIVIDELVGVEALMSNTV